MEWRFWNIFLIYPTISRTRDMSLGNFFECRRCLYGWAKGLIFQSSDTNLIVRVHRPTQLVDTNL
jgi:hypothetical protein